MIGIDKTNAPQVALECAYMAEVACGKRVFEFAIQR